MPSDDHLPGHIAIEPMRLFMARLSPAMLDRIASDCGLLEEADKVAAVVSFCLSHRVTVMDLCVRYPELASLTDPSS